MDVLKQNIFQLQSGQEFNELSLEIFRYQYNKNTLYRQYVDSLGTDPGSVASYANIPFLPIQFFKTQRVVTGEFAGNMQVFTSSGTTGSETSRHHVRDISLYEESFKRTFRLFYGPPSGYIILALLPSYLERGGSSLIYMADSLIRETGHPHSGFYLKHDRELHETIIRADRKVILLGVTYALLDFAESFRLDSPGLIVMETGGMKGRRKEMVREEVHEILCSAFNLESVHSEYGMTELLSQAYSSGKGIYRTPPWMRVLARDTNDPLSPAPHGQTAGLNIIDLANIHSCAFVATQDLGKTYPDGSFEVLGRFDASDIRGCNLMVE